MAQSDQPLIRSLNFLFLICIGLLLALAPAGAGEIELNPILGGFEALPALNIRNRSGKIWVARQDSVLIPGDSFQVPNPGAVWVAFERGFHFLAGRGAQATVGEFSATGLKVPSVRLSAGEARVMVEPKGEVVSYIRFVVETPHAWMGVVGTDFAVKVGESETELKVFSGEVRLALSPTDLDEGNRVSVAARHGITFVSGKPVGEPFEFDVPKFLSQFYVRQPELDLLWRRVSREVRNDRVKPRFKRLRKSLGLVKE